MYLFKKRSKRGGIHLLLLLFKKNVHILILMWVVGGRINEKRFYVPTLWYILNNSELHLKKTRKSLTVWRRWCRIYVGDVIGHAHSGLNHSTSDPCCFTFTDNDADEDDDSDDDSEGKQSPYNGPGNGSHWTTVEEKTKSVGEIAVDKVPTELL